MRGRTLLAFPVCAVACVAAAAGAPLVVRGHAADMDMAGPVAFASDCEARVEGQSGKESRLLLSGSRFLIQPGTQDSSLDYVNYYIKADAGTFRAYTMTSTNGERFKDGDSSDHFDEGFTHGDTNCFLYEHSFPGFSIPDNEYLVVGVECTSSTVSCELTFSAIFSNAPISAGATVAPSALGVLAAAATALAGAAIAW